MAITLTTEKTVSIDKKAVTRVYLIVPHVVNDNDGDPDPQNHFLQIKKGEVEIRYRTVFYDGLEEVERIDDAYLVADQLAGSPADLQILRDFYDLIERVAQDRGIIDPGTGEGI